MARLVLLAALCFLLALATASASAPFSIVAYLPEWRYEGANFNKIFEHCSHLLLFSLEPKSNGEIGALDRLPRPELLRDAQVAAAAQGGELLICFGGNGRSAGFSAMVRSDKARRRFVKSLVRLCDKNGFHGVDYNWEYPGYEFGGGYKSDAEVAADYDGLARLLADTRAAFDDAYSKSTAAGSPIARRRIITLAYYPDGRQEQHLATMKQHVDLMHMMTYDQGSGHHSSFEFAERSAKLGMSKLPAQQLTLGLPFYGRSSATGEWTTFEDLVQKHHPLSADVDELPANAASAVITFNGVKTIWAKTRLAAKLGLGGVMIWEVGQDCRLEPVTHGETTHVQTCPTKSSSLLVAITKAITDAGVRRYRAAGWVHPRQLQNEQQQRQQPDLRDEL